MDLNHFPSYCNALMYCLATELELGASLALFSSCSLCPELCTMAGTTVEETEQYSVAASFVTAASEAVIIVRVRTLAAEFKEEIVAYGMNLMMLLAQLTLTDTPGGDRALLGDTW
mmetsp:Transcript_29962/g.66024  ORF Transcript_29962/g.66024 Transcript_29962/m.66024 type:complete len:115 (+) Transcript_29962:530-874(+)